ncbi:MAG: DUF4369 domain-containing protein [Bacteroidales bacterium]|nr:DUF4369 domain-containing protein [Bacteroidales bacterium]
MKKLILTLIAAAMILCGCNNTKRFKVNLNLDNADGQIIYLHKDLGMVEMCVDSAVFDGNTAVLKADFDDPQTKYILKYDKYDQCGVFTFLPENCDITITGDFNDIISWQAEGSPAMEILNAFHKKLKPYADAVMTIVPDMEAAYAENDTVRGHELYWKAIACMDEYNNRRLDFIRNHPDCYVAHYLLDEAKINYDSEVLKEVVGTFTVESIYKKNIENYLKEIEEYDMPMQIVE